MKVDVNIFDYADVAWNVHRLNDYLAEFKDKADEVCKRLAELGCTRAKLDFSNAIYDGENDVEVNIKPIDNGYAVVASGNAVMFIEFGAGVYYNGSGSYPGELEPGVVGIGEYGQGRGKNNWWYYSGPLGNGTGEPSTKVPGLNITHGNPPAAAMYHAKREVQDAKDRIANEVFNS